MKLIQKVFVYLMLLFYQVKTIVNEPDKLEDCFDEIGSTLVTNNEKSENWLKLINESTVILKAFCSEHLISFFEKNEKKSDTTENQSKLKNNSQRRNEADDYEDKYAANISTLMIFTPVTIYKGIPMLRKLELFNNQEFFFIKG